ncbi:MAG: bacterio-opsin activator domain-containing protein, partial [Halohasta sp.]
TKNTTLSAAEGAHRIRRIECRTALRGGTMTNHESNPLTASSHELAALAGVDSQSELCERTVDIAERLLGHPAVGIELYDGETSRLEPAALSPTADELTGDEGLFGDGRSQPWRVFATQERAVVPDVAADDSIDHDETPLRSAILLPLGAHGVFIAGGTEPGAVDETEVALATMLVAVARSVLDRLAAQRELQAHRSEFTKLSEELEDIQRLHTLTRTLTTELLDAETRDDICQRVCETLVAIGGYQFVWFGSRNPTSTEIVPNAAAGDERGLDGLTLTLDDDPSAHRIVSRAIKHGVPQVDNAIHHDPPFEPWRETAIRRGYRSSVAIPIRYRGTLYGVLSLYAAETEAFGTFERTVLQEVGGLIGYALNAEERRQAFVSQQSVELAFAVDDRSESVLAMVRAVGGELTLENLVERRDGKTTLFFAIEGAETDDVISWATDHAQISAIRVLADRETECLFECVLDASTVWSQLLHRGAVVRYARATAETTRIVLRIPRTTDPRTVETVLQGQFDTVDLVARRDHDEPILTAEQFEADYKNRLTERQSEVLQTAYYAGYFDWPRAITAGELADILGIAQPTVSRHLRSSERKFLSMLYEQQ